MSKVVCVCADVKVSTAGKVDACACVCVSLSLCMICLFLQAARGIKDMDLIKRYRACGEVSG